MTITPNNMPANRLVAMRHQILGELLTPRTTVRKEVRGRRTKQGWVEEPVAVPVPTLAGNVSHQNIEILAKRWI